MIERFRNKQKGGYSPSALKSQIAQEGVDIPYMRSSVAGHTSLKKSGFRETERVSTGTSWINTGDVTIGGVTSRLAPYGSTTYKTPGHRLNIPTSAVDLGFSSGGEQYRVSYVKYIGAGRYSYQAGSGVVINSYGAPAAYQKPEYDSNFTVVIKGGLLSRADAHVRYTGLMFGVFDVAQALTVAPFGGIEDCFQSAIFQPLDVAHGTSLITFSTYIGNVDLGGYPVSDTVYTIVDKSGPGSLLAPPRSENNTHSAMADADITVITPTTWVLLTGAYISPLTVAPDVLTGYWGGYIGLFTTKDAGQTWPITTIFSLPPRINEDRIPALCFNFPLRPADGVPPNVYVEGQYVCALNVCVAHMMSTKEICVISPTTWLMSYGYYGAVRAADGVPDNGFNLYLPTTSTDFAAPRGFCSRLVRTTDAGVTWTQVAPPTLLETVTGWPQYSRQYYIFRSVTYLGAGFMIAKIRASIDDVVTLNPSYNPLGGPLVLNFAVSADYGATWTCVPRVGFPAAATGPMHFGFFKVLRVKKRTGDAGTYTPGLVVIPVWGGDGFYLYQSVDDGLSWTKAALMAKSEKFQPMDIVRTPLDDGGGVRGQNFAVYQYTGPPNANVAPYVEAPWRTDSRLTWKAD